MLLGSYTCMADTPTVFWMTRAEDSSGVLADVVDVWLEQPSRQNLPGGTGCLWLGPGTTGIENRYAQWSLPVARGNTPSGTLPETSRESIRVG